jgi:hypothetical protein
MVYAWRVNVGDGTSRKKGENAMFDCFPVKRRKLLIPRNSSQIRDGPKGGEEGGWMGWTRQACLICSRKEIVV